MVSPSGMIEVFWYETIKNKNIHFKLARRDSFTFNYQFSTVNYKADATRSA